MSASPLNLLAKKMNQREENLLLVCIIGVLLLGVASKVFPAGQSISIGPTTLTLDDGRTGLIDARNIRMSASQLDIAFITCVYLVLGCVFDYLVRAKEATLHAIGDVSRKVDTANKNIVDILQLTRNSAAKFYPDASTAYKAIADAAISAQHTIRTTHIRNVAFPPFPESDEFQANVLTWVRAKSATPRNLYRIISLSKSVATSAKRMIEDRQNSPGCNYHIAGIVWQPDTPTLNIVIIDDSRVFIFMYGQDSNTSTPQSIAATELSGRTVTKRFIEHYSLLFHDRTAIRDDDIEKALGLL